MRNKERGLLEKSAYVQSVSVALIPLVPVIAVIVTFIVHIATGHDLTPAEVNLSVVNVIRLGESLIHLHIIIIFTGTCLLKTKTNVNEGIFHLVYHGYNVHSWLYHSGCHNINYANESGSRANQGIPRLTPFRLLYQSLTFLTGLFAYPHLLALEDTALEHTLQFGSMERMLQNPDVAPDLQNLKTFDSAQFAYCIRFAVFWCAP